MRDLQDKLFAVFRDYLNTRPSFHFRDKTGEHRYMEIEVTFTGEPTPFPCITVRVWPNGKSDEQ